MCFISRAWKVDKTGNFMRTSNASEGETCRVIIRVGGTHLPIC